MSDKSKKTLAEQLQARRMEAREKERNQWVKEEEQRQQKTEQSLRSRLARAQKTYLTSIELAVKEDPECRHCVVSGLEHLELDLLVRSPDLLKALATLLESGGLTLLVCGLSVQKFDLEKDTLLDVGSVKNDFGKRSFRLINSYCFVLDKTDDYALVATWP